MWQHQIALGMGIIGFIALAISTYVQVFGIFEQQSHTQDVPQEEHKESEPVDETWWREIFDEV